MSKEILICEKVGEVPQLTLVGTLFVHKQKSERIVTMQHTEKIRTKNLAQHKTFHP